MREEMAVMVGGVREQWQLVLSCPVPVTAPGANVLLPLWGPSSPFGEAGEVEIVRNRAGEQPEVLRLGYLSVPRWANTYGPDAKRLAQVDSQPSLRVMALADYDHDGQPSEFPLVVDVFSPGTFREDTRVILVGIFRGTNTLSALHVQQHPQAITSPDWSPLLRSNPAEIVQSPCGDHGRAYETTLKTSFDASGLRAEIITYDCVGTPGKPTARGRRLSSEPWHPDDQGVHRTYSNFFNPEGRPN